MENRKDMLPHLYAKFDKTFFAAFAVEVAKGTSTEGRREEREVERKIERWKERGGKGEVERGGGGGGHTPRCTHPDAHTQMHTPRHMEPLLALYIHTHLVDFLSTAGV